MGSRSDGPGSIVVGLDTQRVNSANLTFTASQLYHEHCHNKLALALSLENLPTSANDAVFLSPFKNENRDAVTLLHTVYPVAMECIARDALEDTLRAELPFFETLGYLADLAIRLDLFVDCLLIAPLGDYSAIALLVHALARDVIAKTVARIPESIRERFQRRQRAVLQRHIWDLGQFLIRGVEIHHPHLRVEEQRRDNVLFRFRKEGYSVDERADARISVGAYGRWITEA
jgi:hypothetical protein